MQPILTFTESLFTGWTTPPATVAGVFLLLFLVACWAVCLASVFLKVDKPRLFVVMLSVGMALLVGLLLAGLCHGYFPDLAVEFTPWGLLFFCTLGSSLVFSVPLLQSFWSITYARSLASLSVGVAIFLVAMFAVQTAMKPGKGLSARPNIPIFHEPGGR